MYVRPTLTEKATECKSKVRKIRPPGINGSIKVDRSLLLLPFVNYTLNSQVTFIDSVLIKLLEVFILFIIAMKNISRLFHVMLGLVIVQLKGNNDYKECLQCLPLYQYIYFSSRMGAK